MLPSLRVVGEDAASTDPTLRAVRFSEEILALHRELQAELSLHGTTGYAKLLDMQIWMRLGRVPGIDDDLGEELHLLAYPAAGSRPPRLIRGDAPQ